MGLILICVIILGTIIALIWAGSNERNEKTNLEQRLKQQLDAQRENTQPEQQLNTQQEYEYHYRSKFLLTKNEYYFYKSLKPIADKMGYCILSKVRMADLVEPTCPQYSKQYKCSFSKIKSKHVDFVLADPENLRPILLIELDDSSHDINSERDSFVDSVYGEAGYRILHVRGQMDLEQKIMDSINGS